MGGRGETGHEEDSMEWSSLMDIWDWREILLSGVVIILVDVRMLSGDVTTPDAIL